MGKVQLTGRRFRLYYAGSTGGRKSSQQNKTCQQLGQSSHLRACTATTLGCPLNELTVKVTLHKHNKVTAMQPIKYASDATNQVLGGGNFLTEPPYQQGSFLENPINLSTKMFIARADR